MREIVHIQAGQCGNQIGAKVSRVLRSGGHLLGKMRGKGSDLGIFFETDSRRKRGREVPSVRLTHGEWNSIV